MLNFINVIRKIVTSVSLTSFFVDDISETSQPDSKTETFGGFTSSDWNKIGQDMKRGLIQFGKAK